MPVPTSQIYRMPNEIGTGDSTGIGGLQALAAAIQKAGADAKLKADLEKAAADKAAAALNGTPEQTYTPAPQVQPNPFAPPPKLAGASNDEMQMLQALLAGAGQGRR